MSGLTITSLVWDKFNSQHISRHGVNITEVEEACQSKTKVKQAYERRLLVFGETKSGKLITVVVAPKTKNSYYPVTARSMSRKERRWYQQ